MMSSVATVGGYTPRRAIITDLPFTMSKPRATPVRQRSPATSPAVPTTFTAVSDSETIAKGLDPLVELSGLLDAMSLNTLKSCNGTAEHLLQILKEGKNGHETLKLSSVSLEQFNIIQQVASRHPTTLGKPRFSYLSLPGILSVKWPSKMHETPIHTVDELMTTEGSRLPFPKTIILAQVNHNDGLKAGEDTIIPDVLLEFKAKDDSMAPIYPIICQIAFSQGFEDARQEIRTLASAYPSMCMAIIIDISEEPGYKSPTLRSEAHRTLSYEFMDYVSFVNSSHYRRGSSIPDFSVGPSPKPLVVGGHTWCSIRNVTYHVWVKASDSEHLSVDMSGECYASCTTPGNTGWDDVEAVLLRGLTEVKRSLVEFCEVIIQDMETASAPDLEPLRLHKTTLPISLQSFDEDILSGIKMTSYKRYDDWFTRTFRTAKRSHAARGKRGDAVKKLRPA